MRLIDYRKSLDMGPVDAARQLGANFCTYWRWERQLSIPRPRTMRKIVEWSGGKVTLDDLLLIPPQENRK